MTHTSSRFLVALSCVCVMTAAPAHAQVASLGKGWLLGPTGSVTSAPGEIISGRNSIKGSGDGSSGSLFQSLLVTDPSVVQFTPNQSYTITFAYRIITSSSSGFEYGFSSSTGIGGARDFGPSRNINGSSGSSGTVTTTFSLHNWPDYQVNFAFPGTGAIVIDDIRITDASTAQLAASENGEGPSVVPGPLNYQVTDATAMLTSGDASVIGAAASDLDGDGYPETILTITNARTLASLFQPFVIESRGRMRIATTDFFPNGAPTTMSTPMILFADINGDGLKDIVFAEAGLDRPPFTGARLGIALNAGGGTYRDVSSLIPADQLTDRAYATAVGDVLGDGKAYLILPDENDGANTALLRWTGNGFDETGNWIPHSIWKTPPAELHAQSWMALADFDRDGKLDLLVTGKDGNPNFQIVFAAANGFTAGTLIVLPDGPFGHTGGGPQPEGTVMTAEVSPVVTADFNNDGLQDIFAIIRKFTAGKTINDYTLGNSTYQVRLNEGSRRFADVSPSPYVDLGRVEYQNLMAADMNNDGFMDVVGTYATDPPLGEGPRWGTTLFLNDGTGAFQLVDGAKFIGVTTTPANGKQR